MLDTYDTDRMSEVARAQFKSKLLSAFAPFQREDGTIKTGWGLRLVQASAAWRPVSAIRGRLTNGCFRLDMRHMRVTASGHVSVSKLTHIAPGFTYAVFTVV